MELIMESSRKLNDEWDFDMSDFINNLENSYPRIYTRLKKEKKTSEEILIDARKAYELKDALKFSTMLEKKAEEYNELLKEFPDLIILGDGYDLGGYYCYGTSAIRSEDTGRIILRSQDGSFESMAGFWEMLECRKKKEKERQTYYSLPWYKRIFAREPEYYCSNKHYSI